MSCTRACGRCSPSPRADSSLSARRSARGAGGTRRGGDGSAWERYEVPATNVPRISPEILEEERRTLGEWWFEQEYMCAFLDAETQAFRREDIDRTFGEEVEPWGL
jgi:hypothetical protein